MNDHAHDPRADANIMVAGAPIDGARAVLIVLHGRGASAAAAIMTGGLIGSRIDEARYPRAEHAPHILLTSGDPDPHVPTERVRASAELLTERGFSITTKLYPGRPHTVSRPEVDAAHRLFVDVL